VAETCSEFRFMLENSHVITPSQIWAGVVPVGPAGVALNASYKTRANQDYRADLGNAIGA
jgi:regulator of telomere elongation helicase 1